jgi:hypothetical protein
MEESEDDGNGRLVELIHNLHCEVYEVVVNGIPVFICTDLQQAQYEYNMECV